MYLHNYVSNLSRSIVFQFFGIRNSVSKIKLTDVSFVNIHNNFKDSNDIEFWMYIDPNQQTGIVVSFSQSVIRLYKIENGNTFLTKIFK